MTALLRMDDRLTEPLFIVGNNGKPIMFLLVDHMAG